MLQGSSLASQRVSVALAGQTRGAIGLSLNFLVTFSFKRKSDNQTPKEISKSSASLCHNSTAQKSETTHVTAQPKTYEVKETSRPIHPLIKEPSVGRANGRSHRVVLDFLFLLYQDKRKRKNLYKPQITTSPK
jgi:hypothetical protein